MACDHNNTTVKTSYQNIETTRQNKTMVSGMLSPMSKFLGIPLYMQKYPVQQPGDTTNDGSTSDCRQHLSNPSIKCLLSTLNPKPGENWLLAENLDWKPSADGEFFTGPVVLFRVDGKPLEIRLLKALIAYGKNVLEAKLTITNDHRPEVMPKDQLVEDLVKKHGYCEARKRF